MSILSDPVLLGVSVSSSLLLQESSSDSDAASITMNAKLMTTTVGIETTLHAAGGRAGGKHNFNSGHLAFTITIEIPNLYGLMKVEVPTCKISYIQNHQI